MAKIAVLLLQSNKLDTAQARGELDRLWAEAEAFGCDRGGVDLAELDVREVVDAEGAGGRRLAVPGRIDDRHDGISQSGEVGGQHPA